MKTLEQTPLHDASDVQSQDATNARFNDIMTQEFGDDTLFVAPVVAREESRKRTATPEITTSSSTTEPTPFLTTELIDAPEHETPEAKQSFVRRALGRLSLSRLGADMAIAQMNIGDKLAARREKSKAKHEVYEDDGRLTRMRKFMGRNALAAVAGVVSVGFIGSRVLAMKYGLGSSGSTSVAYETTAVIKPLDPNAPSNPIFVGGHTQGQSDVMPNAARNVGAAGFSGAPRVARYNAEIGRIIPGEGQTWDQSGEQAKNAILAQAKPNDTVYSHSQGTNGALRAAGARPDLNVIAVASPYAPNNGLFAPHSVTNSKTVSPVLKAFGISTENPGPANGRNITYKVNDGGMANGGRGTGDVWTASVEKDGTFNPFRVGSNALGTQFLGTHELDAHTGTPYKVTVNPDGSKTEHYNSGTRVINPQTGKPYESGYTATLQKNNGISTPANIDRAAKLLEGDENGNINARAVGEAVAPGLGNFTAAFQPLADAIKPAQHAIANPTPDNINKVFTGVTQTLGGGSAPAANRNVPAPVLPRVNAAVNVQAQIPAVPNIPKLPTPQEIQANPVGAGLGFVNSLFGAK